MGRYRKVPIEVEAVRWDGVLPLHQHVKDILEGQTFITDEHLGTLSLWNTEERQYLDVPPGHWIIKGVNGEVYPCSPDVFDQTYEPVVNK